jgi:hypothetical protein
MKWVAGMLALLAVVSGCMSLNKGSDQVALVAPSKPEAKKQALSSPPANVPAVTVAATTSPDRPRAGSRREADFTAEVKAASLPAGADLPSERTSTRVVRASPPETARPQPPVFSPEQAPAVPVVARSETVPQRETVSQRDAEQPAAAATGSSDVKLPMMINGTAAMAPLLPAAAVEPPAARPTAAAVRLINAKRIGLNYEIKDVGPSGVSAVELWYTQDGKKWEKSDTISKPRPPFVVDLKDEGLYGFTLVARNGVGLGRRPPSPGDQPQIWVEVDVTKPVVKLLDVQPGLLGEGQHLSICWKATDTNLGQRPITLSFAEQAAGPWTVIASNIENTGVYAWQLPPAAPPKFLLRVEAVDLVGNVGIAQTPDPILLDLSQPSISIVAVEPAAK